MNIDISILIKFIEIFIGAASSIFFFAVMVYRLSYKIHSLSERFKEHAEFLKEFKNNFDDFKLSTSKEIAQIKVTLNVIEKKIDEVNFFKRGNIFH